jgi:hypothetical protein
MNNIGSSVAEKTPSLRFSVVPKTAVFGTLLSPLSKHRFYGCLCVPKPVPESTFRNLTNSVSFGTLFIRNKLYMSTEQKKRLLKAKIAVALHDELGRVPKQEEIEQVFLMARVMWKAVLGLHFKRKEQKKTGQLPIF